jgi:hypothetical protein
MGVFSLESEFSHGIIHSLYHGEGCIIPNEKNVVMLERKMFVNGAMESSCLYESMERLMELRLLVMNLQLLLIIYIINSEDHSTHPVKDACC